MSRAATTPSATAAAVPFSRLRGITVKPVAHIAKPAAAAATWMKVKVISPTFRAFDWLHHNPKLTTPKIKRDHSVNGGWNGASTKVCGIIRVALALATTAID
jgi:hypothetical protein